MKLIKSQEISGKILSLIHESEEKVIIVSPYFKILGWIKLQKRLKELEERKVDLDIYIRKEKPDHDNYKELDRLGYKYTEIPNLHAKLYMNEKIGIVTSMNLLLSSERNSIEIGYITENRKEYEELMDYFIKSILRQTEKGKKTIDYNNGAKLVSQIQNQLKDMDLISFPWIDGDILRIKTKSSDYNISIKYIGKNTLHIDSEINKNEYNKFNKAKNKLQSITGMLVDLLPRSKGEYDGLQAIGTIGLKSKGIKGISKSETDYIIRSVTGFINIVEELKADKQGSRS